MKLELKRIFRGPEYTIGKLYIDGAYFCDTLEDPDRDLNRDGKFDNGEVKVPGNTCVPNGTYDIEFKYSPTFSPKINKRYMPYLKDVPSFEAVMMHWGNTAEDTRGCILVGQNKVKGKVLNSIYTFKKLLNKISRHIEGVSISIS
jgi:hypothetical protein